MNAIWYRCSADYYPPAERPERGRPAQRRHLHRRRRARSGFPVSPEFAEPGNFRESRPKERARPLPRQRAQSASRLSWCSGWRHLRGIALTVAVGRDRRLRRAIAAIQQLAPRPFRLVGWSEELPRLLRSSHLLISKAGGATVQEAIAAGCPMIVNHVIPGQEEGNARYLVQTNTGTIATTPEAVLDAVQNAFANDAARWREWSRNIAELSRPAASLETARFLLSL